MKNIFELLNLEIDGSVIVTELMNNWISFFGTEKNKIEKIEVLLYEDYSGIFDASIILSDSTKVKFREPEIDVTINDFIAKSFIGYEVLYWVAYPKEHNQNEENVLIEQCTFDIIAMKTDQQIESSSEAFDLIIKIIAFVGREYYNYTSFYYDSFFEEGSYLMQLLKLITDNNRIDLIDQLIFKNSLINRQAREAIARQVIHIFNDPLTDEQKKLVTKLIKDQELLNEYSKGQLNSNFIDQKKISSSKTSTI